jgi:calmodulin
MFQLSDSDIEEFREIFGLVDTDGSGKISAGELGQLTKKLGLNYSEVSREIQVLVDSIGPRNNSMSWLKK